MTETDSEYLPSWYPTLIEWIHNAGGHVHEFLELRGTVGGGGTIVTERGIVCTGGTIQKGDLLIRLPASLALSGQDMPDTYDGNKIASPWLRCIGALYQAVAATSNHHTPYMDSLPSEYETLFQWSKDDVTKYLGGTAIARVLETDRETKMLETQYSTCVRPYLESLSIPLAFGSSEEEEEELERFRQACMCISTRCFHMQQSSSSSSDDDDDTYNDNDNNNYSGPFLLPWIDLINHNPAQSCTTLKRDNNNHPNHNFIMIAERNVVKGEQIFHSYGNNLSSGQCLQTFGFVPEESIQHAISNGAVAVGGDKNVTPAVLSRADVILACQEMIQSGYPEHLKTHIKSLSRRLCGDEDYDVWDVSIHEDRNFDWVSNELLVCYTSPLSDELVTLLCFLLLPDDTYQEFIMEEDDSPSVLLLDSSILEDYFLGKLVCQSLLLALQKKKTTYPTNATTTNLSTLYYNTKQPNTSVITEHQRAMHGWTICVEEMACLEALRKHVLEIMDSLDDDDDDDNEEVNLYPGTSKRRRDE